MYGVDTQTAIPKCVYVQWEVGKWKTVAEKHAEIMKMLGRFIANEQSDIIGMQEGG